MSNPRSGVLETRLADIRDHVARGAPLDSLGPDYDDTVVAKELLDALAARDEEIARLRAQLDHWDSEVARLGTSLIKADEENTRLRLALADAADAIEEWGAYADDYFKEKWNLKGDIAAARAALEANDG